MNEKKKLISESIPAVNHRDWDKFYSLVSKRVIGGCFGTIHSDIEKICDLL